jgi:hypothetical protein
MLSRRIRYFIAALLILTGLAGVRLMTAQDATPAPADDPDCTPERIQQQQETYALATALDFENNPALSLENMYQLGAYYQQLAVKCGYAPTEEDITQQIDFTLSISDLQTIIQSLSVGRDVDAIMTELETVSGDSFTGQLLFNGMEPLLDGEPLACANCHTGVNAPDIVGTYTRVTDIRLTDPALQDYTVERYLVESIVNPHAYAVPDYDPALMPDGLGSRLDIQMIADILVYLESQDQELPGGE